MYQIYIIIFISSNYLIVSGEHRVHFNTNDCSRFCYTTHPFRLSGTHRCSSTWGSVFILVSRRECVSNRAVYFKAISPITQPYRFLVSLHMYDTRHSLFGLLPVPCVHCCGFGNMALHRVRLFSVIGYFFASSTSANNH